MNINRLFIHLVSLLVARSLRERWREEWLAELSAQPRRCDRRVLGAFADAVATRRASRTSGLRDFGTPRTPGLRDSALSGVTEDMRLSLRLARRHPGYSALTMVVVALSVGLMTAVLSVGYAVFLKPWPIHEPDRVAFVFRNNAFGLGTGRLNEHTPDYDVVKQNVAIAAVAGFQQFFPEITIDGATSQIPGELVTAGYFDVIGVKPLLGRTFHPNEDTPANPELSIVLSHRIWQQRFEGRPDIVGTQVAVADKVATVIGVLGPEFYGLSSAYARREWWMLARPFRNVPPAASVIRLHPGASVDQAAAGLAAYGLHVNDVEKAKGFGSPAPEGAPVFEVIPANQMRTPMTPSEILVPQNIMWGLVAVVGMVVIIAVASIAGLGVARSLDRESEVATRRVLGVSNWRLARQLMMEQSLLTVAGGVLASAVAWYLLTLALRSIPEHYVISTAPDWRLFLIAVSVSLAVGGGISLAPLRHALRIDLLRALHGTSATTARPASRLGFVSLTPQITLAVVLLVTASVHVRALLAVNVASLGYTIDNRVILEVNTSAGMFTDTPLPRAERRAMLARLSAVMGTWPGVNAGFIETLPLQASGAGGTVASSETSMKNHSPDAVAFGRRHTSPGTFAALNIPILAGRDFAQRDYEHQAPVAVVTQTLAERLWPNTNPIGQRFMAHSSQGAAGLTEGSSAAAGRWVEVIGTVPEVTPLVRWKRQGHPVYTVTDAPLRVNVVIAGTSDPIAITRIRDDIQAVHPTLRVTSIRPMQAVADEILRPRRTAATILAVTGFAGLTLACIGLYAHVALSVARRRREFGIRSALGASAGTLVIHIVRDHGRIALVGTVLGLGGAIATLRLASRVVRDVPTADLTTFVIVPLILIGVCLVACVLPARRAGAIDPVSTLKA